MPKAPSVPRPPSGGFEEPWICFVSKQHLTDPNKPVSSRSAVELHAYANRTKVTDHTGKIHDFQRAKQNHVGSRMYFPEQSRHLEALEIWQEADKAAALTGRPTEIISTHMLCRLPQADPDICFEMIDGFADQFLVPMGLVVEASFHDPVISSKHVHFQISKLPWSEDGVFTNAFYHATSQQTRAGWRRGWVDALKAYANQN